MPFTLKVSRKIACSYNPNQGTWKEPFDRRVTSEADFYTLTEGVVKCQMMYDDGTYEYAHLEEIDADAIKIPFH